MFDIRNRCGIPTLVAVCTTFSALAAYAEPYYQSGDQPYVENILNQSRDGKRVLKRSVSDSYNVEVWDPDANKLLGSIKGLSGVVNVANISPDGRKVVTAERRGIVGLWDAETGAEIRLLRGHGDQIHDARFSPDGKMIASGARDGTARTWDAETGAQIAVHKQKAGDYVDMVSFSPDGKWVLSAGNGWAEIWNARTGALHSATAVAPEGEGGYTTSARLSPDGKAILIMNDEDKPADSIPIKPPLE